MTAKVFFTLCALYCAALHLSAAQYPPSTSRPTRAAAAGYPQGTQSPAARDSRANPNQCGGRCFVRKFSRQITRVFNNVNGQRLRCQGSIYLYRCEGLCPSNLYIHPLSLALVRTAQCCVPLSQTLQARQRVRFNCHTLYGYPVTRTAFANVFRPRRCECRRC